MKIVNQVSDLGIKSTDRVLVIMPHPDDEAVFVAGLLHKLAQDQIKTRVLVMTRGEKSTLRYGLKLNDDLAVARTKEQQQAFNILGIKDYQIFDYPDGGIETKMSDIGKRIQKDVGAFRPTHVVTLEPDGIYGHPDHVALSCAVTKFASATRKILYATVSPNYTLPSAKHMAKKKTITPIKPDYQLRLSTKNIITKLKALNAHRSQFYPVKHPSAYWFFLVNHLLTNEFFIYKHMKN